MDATETHKGQLLVQLKKPSRPTSSAQQKRTKKETPLINRETENEHALHSSFELAILKVEPEKQADSNFEKKNVTTHLISNCRL